MNNKILIIIIGEQVQIAPLAIFLHSFKRCGLQAMFWSCAFATFHDSLKCLLVVNQLRFTGFQKNIFGNLRKNFVEEVSRYLGSGERIASNK